MSAQKTVATETKTATNLPYHQIPDYPEKMTGGAAIGRVIDGLGYRYYWATEGLRAEDLAYEPGNGGQPVESVLGHLYGLSLMIMQSAKKEPNVRPLPENTMTWEEQRVATLQNFKAASDIFKAASDEEMATFDIIFQRGEEQNKVPVWHLFNGPLDDAIYHVGQIVSFRRTSGNPMNPFVNVFMGKTKE
ncbi:MAG: hypothetical protein AAGJ18_18800 [Bacteroidota bacterium]